MSMAIAVHPPMAASSSSVGVKSAPPPVPRTIWPPRLLVTVSMPLVTRSTVTLRCAGSVAIPQPCQTPAAAGRGWFHARDSAESSLAGRCDTGRAPARQPLTPAQGMDGYRETGSAGICPRRARGDRTDRRTRPAGAVPLAFDDPACHRRCSSRRPLWPAPRKRRVVDEYLDSHCRRAYRRLAIPPVALRLGQEEPARMQQLA